MSRRNQIVRAVVAIAFVALLAIPFVGVSGSVIQTLTIVVMVAAMGQAWNLIGGYTGYGAFGNVAFFGVGGYTTAILMNRHLDFIPSVIAGGIVAALYAALLGLPILRLKGHYFSIATLGIAEATREIIANADALTGGGSGIILPISPDSPVVFYRFIYFCMVAVYVGSVALTYVVTRSKFGYGLVAIREDEDAAKSLGINTTQYKVAAFALNALIVGLLGGVYAYKSGQLTPPDAFLLDWTLRGIIVSIIGGPGTVLGPTIGALVFEFARDYLWNNFQGLQFTFLGLVMVFVIVFMPKGLMDFITGRRRFTLNDLLRYVRQNRVA